MLDYFPSNKTKLIPLLSFSTVLGIFHSSHQSDDCSFTFLLTYVKCYEVLSFVHPQIYKLCSASFSFWQQNHWKMLHLFSILIQKPPSLLSFLWCLHNTLLIHTNGWLWQAFKQPAWENSNSLPWPEEQKQAAVEKVIMKQKLWKQPHHLTLARPTFQPSLHCGTPHPAQALLPSCMDKHSLSATSYLMRSCLTFIPSLSNYWKDCHRVIFSIHF